LALALELNDRLFALIVIRVNMRNALAMIASQERKALHAEPAHAATRQRVEHGRFYLGRIGVEINAQEATIAAAEGDIGNGSPHPLRYFGIRWRAATVIGPAFRPVIFAIDQVLRNRRISQRKKVLR
jgi:hypothetical protein